MKKIYIPRDAAVKALGSDEVAATLADALMARGEEAQIIRNGSRGMIWLEPLVEIEENGTRLAYGPIAADQVEDLLAGKIETLGPVEDIPFFA